MQSIDLTPEYREKSEKLKIVKELYLTFLLEYNDLIQVVKPNDCTLPDSGGGNQIEIKPSLDSEKTARYARVFNRCVDKT